MKIIVFVCSIVLCMALFNCKDKQQINQQEEVKFTLQLDSLPALKKVVEELEAYNVVESEYVGDGGYASEQWKRYNQLKEIATMDQLVALTDYANPVVRCYAFRALAAKNSDQVFPILLAHLQDTTRVETLSGCLGGSEYTGDYFVGVVKYYEEDYPGYKLNEVEQTTLESIFIYDENIVLYERRRVLEDLAPQAEYYSRIRQVVKEKRESAALVVLAKYKKQEDKALIASFLQEDESPYQALQAILEFTDDYFYDEVVQFFEEGLNSDQLSHSQLRLCYQVLAKYPNEKTVELFNRTFQIEDEYRRETCCEYLLLAMLKYSNALYNPIQAKIKLRDYSMEQVKYELEHTY